MLSVEAAPRLITISIAADSFDELRQHLREALASPEVQAALAPPADAEQAA